jgi:uncharacterized protein (DUF1697 family)
MARTTALLRAINVGGHAVKMDRLAALFRELGLTGVQTFIASGNVLFDPPAGDPAAWELRIGAHLEAALGFDVTTLLREADELADVAASTPPGFPVDPPEGQALSVAFLREAPGPDAAARLLARATPTDVFHLRGRELWWWCHGRVSDSKITGGVLEKAAGMPMTVRNINTTRKLAALAQNAQA